MSPKSTKYSCLFAVFFVFSAIAAQLYAGQVSMFGPKTYVRTTGAPNVFNETFSAIPQAGKLIVRNGQWDGDKRVTDAIDSAKVVVNGEQIFGPSDFNEHVYYLEATVNLVDNNSLRVELRSDPGSYLAIEVTQEVPEPTTTLSADPQTIVLGESSALSWTSTNADSCLIDPDIGSVDVSGSTQVSPTAITTYTITAIGLGGTASASATVDVIYPPSITVIEPDGVDDTVDNSYTIKWTDSDPDDNATISLYYDIDNTGVDGTLIVAGLSEDPDVAGDDEYVWDTTEIPDGSYYVYAVIDDGVNDPVVDYSDGMVTIQHTPISFPEFKITASDGAQADYFGTSLSISGDYAIVGAYGDDNVGKNTGSAYIFKRNGDTWTEQAKLTPYASKPSPVNICVSVADAECDHFFYPAYESGDVVYENCICGYCYDFYYLFLEKESYSNDKIITGIEFYDNGTWLDRTSDVYWSPRKNMTYQSDKGWIWAGDKGELRVRGGWEMGFRPTQMRITFEDIGERMGEGEGGPSFGASVSISGDYAIVGASGDNDLGSGAGAAYIYRREGSNWIEQAKIVGSDVETYDYFGGSVSINGDYAIVGAYGDDDGGSSAGAAYIFHREGSTWTEQAKLTASGAEQNDSFGDSVSINRDYAIVGAYGDNDNGSYAGAAYIFKREGSTWIEEAKLSAGDGEAYDYFGGSVSINGEYVIVGASRKNDGGTYVGAAYIFKHEGSAWTENAKLTASDREVWDRFGDSVSISGNLAVVGARYNDDNGSSSGSAYIFKLDGSGWKEQVKLTASDAEAWDSFGTVCIDQGRAIVGARGDDDLGSSSGSAYVYQIRTADISADPKVIQPGETSILSWDSVNAGSRVIEPGIGSVRANGFTMVSPAETTTYTITATGPFGTATASDTLFVGTGPPTVNLSANPGSIQTGESLTLSWDSTYADSCSIEPGIGSINVTGSIMVTPSETTTYTITATGPEGTGTAKVTVMVTSSAPTVSFSPYARTIYTGQGSTLTWSSTDADSCVIEPGIGSVDLKGSIYVSPTETTTYIITATGPAGTATADVTVTVLSNVLTTVSLYTYPSTIYYVGQRSYMRWASTNADSCVIEPGLGSVAVNGSTDVSPTETTTYTITATGPGGAATASVTIFVGYVPPTVSLSANPESIQAGESSTLSWTSMYANTSVIEPGIGDVNLGGSLAVTPSETTTYTITATGPGGTTTANVTVTVTPVTIPEPTVSIGANPATIQNGESSRLSWTSADADSCVIQPGIGSVVLSGSIYVTPSEATTYTITASGPGGTATESVAITVAYPQPTVTISATPALIQSGEPTTLLWSSTDADSCTIEPGIGSVGPNGSITVTPTESTDYAITATGLGGTATASFRVYIIGEGYSYGDPTPAEQAHLEAINRARLDPQAEAGRLGLDLNEGLPPGTISENPVQPLTFNAKLHQAAYLHSQDMIVQQYYAHNSLDGRTFSDRVLESGYQFWAVGENIAYYVSSTSMDEIDTILAFHDLCFIDAGYEGRGHRLNILNDNFKEVGLAAVLGSYNEYPYCYKFTCDFAASSTEPDSFLLGVVYDDQNADGIYTAGEGIGSVDIVIVESGDYTSTASAGGYGIPLPPGNYTVKAILTDGREAYSQITIADKNVKVDFLLSDFSFPVPIVSITAYPETVMTGDSSTLAWTSTLADTCVIEPGVGSVSTSGSFDVSPTVTTTYAITATGPGGTATANVTVAVSANPPPAVRINADPETILSGESSTLTWDSIYADSCVIDPDIGSVAVDGSTAVSPIEPTTYTITATGPGGVKTDSITVTVISPISIQITSPSDGELISSPFVNVQGTLSNSTGNETGVTVNGIIATVYGSQFIADHVALEEGENTITATAMDTDGHLATATVTVNAVTTGDYIRITADTQVGVSPLETTLTVEGSFSFTQPYLTYTGPGVVEFLESPEENEYKFRMTGEGVYYFTAQVTDDQSNVYTDTVVVIVMDQAELDTLLKAKWNGMKTALIAGDIQGALSFHHGPAKGRYEVMYNALGCNLPVLAQQMQDIEFVYANRGRAKYRIRRDHNIGGQVVTINYYIYFSKDGSGLWKIEKY